MMNFGFTPFGGIVMILWLILVVVGVIVLVKWILSLFKEPHSSHTDKKSALKILQERYAKGEIDKEEFTEKKKDIGTSE